MFGPWRQTAALLTLGVHGGTMTFTALHDRMKCIACFAPDTRLALQRLEERRMIRMRGERISFHPAFTAGNALIVFANASTTAMPTYRLEPHTPFANPRNAVVANNYYGGGGGLPELFGRPVRYRIFTLLATHGPMRRSDLQIITKARGSTVDLLLKEGWLRRVHHTRGNLSRMVVTIAEVTAREAFIATLFRMTDRWPAPVGSIIPAPVGKVTAGPPQRIEGKDYFGSEARSNTLLTLAAMGQADVAMLVRGIKVHDNHEISRSLRMFTAFGIVPQCRLDGRENGGWELDPTWVAAAELRALLDELLAIPIEGRYNGRADAAEDLMSGRRRARRTNSAKREGMQAPHERSVRENTLKPG